MNLKKNYSDFIKNKSIELGFISCGISKSAFLENEIGRFESWLKNNYHGQMSYMERNFDKRMDTRKLVDGSKSVISLLFNYYPSKEINNNSFKISKYAYGNDYHFIIKDKLKTLLSSMRNEIGEIDGRVFVDSAPIMEKAWAKKSGLGWIGKNTNLISKKTGSFFFIAEIIVDLELEYDNEVTDHCGSCTACLDACPTDALYEPYKIDASKCISYFTIELKEQFPNDLKKDFNDWIFGCDICQDVCPWNKFSIPNKEPLLNPKNEINQYSKKDWLELTDEVFKVVFKETPLERTKFKGLKRNIQYANDQV
ncbi:MAG: tRNA epoxyqueuosine(34) reductase QueG [Flavobacteriaceae bacterium]|jgi:epoxyqueuosine reductase